MKNLIAFLSIMLTSSAFAAYEKISVPAIDIDQYLTYGSDETNTPKNLQGLWWMDGNPLADEVLSFAGAIWSEEYEDGELIGYVARIAVYDEGIWSWHDTTEGNILYNMVLGSKLVYEAHFNLDFTFGQVTPNIQPSSVFPEIVIPSSPFIDFSMIMINDVEWRRDSVLLGQASSYRFRQIVDGAGNRLPAYDDYVYAIESRGPANALLPVCDLEGDVLPTPCARD